MFSHILIATDGSDVSDRAADQAIDLAAKLGARVSVLHVAPAEPAFAYFAQGIEGAGFEPGEAAKHTAAYLDTVRVKAEGKGLACTVHSVVDNRPYCEIVSVAQAQGCDLIVMGSHGRHGLDRLILGSETQKVLLSTALPVLVCH